MAKHIQTIFLLCFVVCACSGCNTIKGFGEDLKATGENISEAVDNVFY